MLFMYKGKNGRPLPPFDPNEKEVDDVTLTPGELAAGKYLEYTIHFQNTGNAPASFIRVIDTLSANLDASTFERHL